MNKQKMRLTAVKNSLGLVERMEGLIKVRMKSKTSQKRKKKKKEKQSISTDIHQ